MKVKCCCLFFKSRTKEVVNTFLLFPTVDHICHDSSHLLKPFFFFFLPTKAWTDLLVEGKCISTLSLLKKKKHKCSYNKRGTTVGGACGNSTEN